MFDLYFVDSNRGVIAIKRYSNSGKNYSKAWLRYPNKEWKKIHYPTKGDVDFNSELLEQLYLPISNYLPFENWW